MSALAEGMPSTLLVLWRKVRQLLPVYTAIADTFHFAAPPCADVSALDADNEKVLQIAAWIEEIDAISQPHHLRTVLQELDVCSSDICVSIWLQHFISKPVRTSADRDKIDFLLSHYLRMNLPPSLQEGKPNYGAMKALLEPVLGSCEGNLPEEAREVDELIGIAERCRCLAEFEQSGIIRRGRELKVRAGESYYTPPFLLAFTHFNAVVRRECLRLMNSDLKFIGDALNRLDQQGITHIDCTAAAWSDREPVSELKNKWATWELASNDYSQDFFASLIAFRSSVEEALERCIELSMTSVAQELRSINALLLEMRAQIDQLPRKLAPIPPTKTTREAASVVAKPVLVWQSTAKPVTPAPAEITPQEPRPDTSVAAEIADPATEKEFEVTAPECNSPDVAGVDDPAVPIPHPNIAAALPPTSTEAIAPAPPKPATDIVAAAMPAVPPTAQAVPAELPSERKSDPVSDAAVAAPAPEPATPTAASAVFDLDAGIARLQQTLSGKRPSAVSIAVAGTRILLTAAEAGMFSVNDNRYAHGVQRAVMMRICIVGALETHSKSRDKTTVAALVPAARTEQATMRDLIAECKAQKLAREEEILSATAKQLSAMLERAERIAR